MKANELMVGNWVYNHRDWECPIVEIHKNSAVVIAKHYGEEEFLLSDLRPIPLTPEILEKNGFIRNIFNIYELSVDTDTFNNLISYQPNYGGIYICKETSEGDFLSEIQLKLQYVHELQNAMYLFKIEKEIVL